MREDAIIAIKNVIEFAEVLKEQHPEYRIADTLAEHIIDISQDYDPETIRTEKHILDLKRYYKELMTGREEASMLNEGIEASMLDEGINPYEE